MREVIFIWFIPWYIPNRYLVFCVYLLDTCLKTHFLDLGFANQLAATLEL